MKSAAELASMETLAVPLRQTGRHTHLHAQNHRFATFPRNKELFDAIQSKIRDLTASLGASRPHELASDPLDLYRSGLTALLNDPTPDNAKQLLQEAHRQRLAEMTNHQKLVDYVNWFEVTKDYNSTSHFNSYFTTAQEMEKVQETDPAHPNPIRANLLQVESQSDLAAGSVV